MRLLPWTAFLFLAPCANGDVAWKPAFVGVAITAIERNEPRPIRAHAVRIDLRAAGIEIVTTPSNGEAPGETDGMKTSSFLRKMGCKVAVNAAPFSPIHFLEGKPQDVSGLMIAKGEVVSPAQGALPVLWIGKGNRVGISRNLDLNRRAPVCAVSGFGIVLENGEVKGQGTPLHPRTAAAISRDGNHLYLLVVDGRQKGRSEGVSTEELGGMLKQLGGWKGINLDGGGTTTLVIEDEEGKPKIVNRPIHAGIPGNERVAGSHLGIRARPLD